MNELYIYQNARCNNKKRQDIARYCDSIAHPAQNLRLMQSRDYWHTAEDHEQYQICLQEPSPLSWLPMMQGNPPRWLGTVHNISTVQLMPNTHSLFLH